MSKKYNKALEKAKEIYRNANHAYSHNEMRDILSSIFPEVREVDDDKTRKEMIDFFNGFYENKNVKSVDVKPWVEWLEKHGRQTSGRRFKIGDWIIYNDIVMQIKEVGKDSYRTSSVQGLQFKDADVLDKEARPWDVRDARKNDVLINWNDTIFIFDKIEDDTVKYTVAFNEKWDEQVKFPKADSHLGLPEPQFEFQPVTTEQRDHFFRKLREAGYVWDFHSKTMKKTENVIQPKFEVGDVMRTLDEAESNIVNGLPVICSIDNKYYNCTNERIQIKDQDDYEYPPLNKIEVKFNTGDWVVFKTNEVTQITKVDVLQNTVVRYWTTNKTWFENSADARLWTIQDVKPGDVVTDNEIIVIFKEFKEKFLTAYAGVYLNNDMVEKESTWKLSRDFHPATEEQLDVLFNKLKAAGYEWNPEKLELNSVKRNDINQNDTDQEMIAAVNQIMKDAEDDGCNCVYLDDTNIEVFYTDVRVWLNTLIKRLTN